MSESRQPKPKSTNTRILNAYKIMNIKSTSRFEGLADCVNDGTLKPLQLLAISDQLVAASDHSLIDLTSHTAVDQVDYCTLSLDRAKKTRNVCTSATWRRSSAYTIASSKTSRATVPAIAGWTITNETARPVTVQQPPPHLPDESRVESQTLWTGWFENRLYQNQGNYL